LPVDITFIRHGQTTGNSSGKWQGHTNGALTADGRDQARRLGARLAGEHFDLVLSSDLERARDTALALGREVETDERWREPFFGTWEDCTTEEILAHDREGLSGLLTGEDVALGGGERLSEVFARMSEALDDAVARVGNGSVAVVSHGMSLLTLLSGLLTAKRPSPLGILGNTAIARWVVDGGRHRMNVYNDDTHLEKPSEFILGRQHLDPILYLVRHGQTPSNTDGRWQGHLDGKLNEEGRRQAKMVAGVLPEFDALYASPLSRAADTAGAVAEEQGLDVSFDDRLKEIHFGDWEGLTTKEIAEEFPEESRDFFAGRDVRRGGSGETFDEVQARIRESLQEIAAAHPSATVGVFAHGGVTRAWAGDILQLPYESRGSLSILDNTGFARIAFGSRGPQIVSWNLTPHLEDS